VGEGVVSGDHGRPVVVAVGNISNGQAVDWAAAEASVRRCPLHVVHAARLRYAVDPLGLVPVADFSSYRVAGKQVLEEAVSRVRSVAPDIEVSAESVVSSTVSLLVVRARGAQLLVLGCRDAPFPKSLRRHLIQSVCGAVARRAPCPVAVVRPLRSAPYAGSAPRVVVGVGRPGASAAALAVAFQAAAQRGVSLAAVHAWTPDVPADHEAVCGPATEAEAGASLALDLALEPWRSLFPDVPVETRLVVTEPAAALIRESEGAALVVVGSRGHGAARAMLFGSVSRGVTQRARCPVVVVRSREAVGVQGIHPNLRSAVHLADPTEVHAARRRRTPWD
jgi:nucleotide-binding universal stress UspA family protein